MKNNRHYDFFSEVEADLMDHYKRKRNILNQATRIERFVKWFAIGWVCLVVIVMIATLLVVGHFLIKYW